MLVQPEARDRIGTVQPAAVHAIHQEQRVPGPDLPGGEFQSMEDRFHFLCVEAFLCELRTTGQHEVDDRGGSVRLRALEPNREVGVTLMAGVARVREFLAEPAVDQGPSQGGGCVAEKVIAQEMHRQGGHRIGDVIRTKGEDHRRLVCPVLVLADGIGHRFMDGFTPLRLGG